MENYILILLTILVVLVIGIVYFGYRQLNHLRVTVNKNTTNLSALQSYLSRSPDQNVIPDNTLNVSPLQSMGGNYDSCSESELSSVDNIHVSDSESEAESEPESEPESEAENNMVEHFEKTDNEELSQKDLSKLVTEIETEERTEEEDEEDEEKEEDYEENTEEVIEEVIEEVTEEVTDGFMDEIDNNTKIIELKTSEKKVGKRLSPNSLPKDFDVGYQEVSENDGNTYEVVANKNGIKRWKRV